MVSFIKGLCRVEVHGMPQRECLIGLKVLSLGIITIPIYRDTILCHFAQYTKMRHILCWNAPYMTLLEMCFHHCLRM